MIRYRITRGLLLFWTLFIGLGAVGGSCAMFYDPTGAFMGMDVLLPLFQVLPFSKLLFRSFWFPGIALLLINGLPNLAAAVLLIRKKPVGILLGGLLGCTLMAWICIQFYLFGPNFMDNAYFAFGLAQAITGYACRVFFRQVSDVVNPADYPNIGTAGDTLVVYFSRLGRVRRLACEAAERCGGELFELKTKEPTADTLGFWWCGRFGMHRWPMALTAMPEGLARYRRVILCTPVWVFGPCGPVRDFCRQAASSVQTVEYIVVHFNRRPARHVARELDELLGVPAARYTDVRCRLGRFRVLLEETRPAEARAAGGKTCANP